jgi:hypothetical protein
MDRLGSNNSMWSQINIFSIDNTNLSQNYHFSYNINDPNPQSYSFKPATTGPLYFEVIGNCTTSGSMGISNIIIDEY